jgi:2-iminobutanoate/2-iminopropanoate deaminase
MPRAEAITAENLPIAAAEKFKYSFGVRVGNLMWVSGQVALKDGRIVGVDDVRAQTEQVFTNLKTVLEAAGGSLDDLVETTTYMTDRSYSSDINEVRARFLTGDVLPTSTLLVVAGLARPEFLVEISAVAHLAASGRDA